MRHNDKILIIILVIVGFLVIRWRIITLRDRLVEKEMTKICREEYGMVYSHHNNYYFWCYKPAENIVVDIEKVQWGDIERPFEVPKINLSAVTQNIT